MPTSRHAGKRDAKGHALVVRNGVAEPSKVTTAAGELEILRWPLR